MKLNPESVARASSRHPWRTLGAWFLAIVAMGALSGSLLAGVLTQDIAFTNKPESVKAQDIIDQHFSNGADTSDTEFLIVQSDSLTVDDPAFQDRVQSQDELSTLGRGDVLAPAVHLLRRRRSSRRTRRPAWSRQDRHDDPHPRRPKERATRRSRTSARSPTERLDRRVHGPGRRARARSAPTSRRSPRRTSEGRVDRHRHRADRADRGLRGRSSRPSCRS